MVEISILTMTHGMLSAVIEDLHGWRRWGGLALVAWVWATLGCVAEPSDGGECLVEAPEEVVHTESIDFLPFGTDLGEICPSSFTASEEHARWVATVWGDAPKSFDYEVFDSKDNPCWFCLEGAGACYAHGTVGSTRVPERHEIAHAVRGSPCYPLIEEGWAMLHGEHFQLAQTSGDVRAAVAAIARPGGLPGEFYPVAARFVAFLIETRGVVALREMCEHDADDPDSFDASLSAVYGKSLDELATEFEGYPEWGLSHIRQDQACEASAGLVSPASWSFDFPCGPGVEGKRGEWMQAAQVVELPESGPYRFDFVTAVDLDLTVELRSCERDGMASVYFSRAWKRPGPDSPDPIVLFDLPAGVYVIRVAQDEPVDVVLEMSVASAL